MPLFADQFINVERAKRFGTALTLDKLNLTPEKVESAIRQALTDSSFRHNAKRLAAMLNEKASEKSILSYGLKLATLSRDHYALKAAQKLNFMQFYNFDVVISFILLPIVTLFLLIR